LASGSAAAAHRILAGITGASGARSVIKMRRSSRSSTWVTVTLLLDLLYNLAEVVAALAENVADVVVHLLHAGFVDAPVGEQQFTSRSNRAQVPAPARWFAIHFIVIKRSVHAAAGAARLHKVEEQARVDFAA
jgi:hypothetical protein